MISHRNVQEIPLALGKVSAKETHEFSPTLRNRKRWVLVLYLSCFCGVTGLLAGLFTSLSTVIGLIERTREIGLGVSVVSITAFALLICAAHAMDRIAEIEMNEKLRKFEEELTHESHRPIRAKTH